MRRNKFLIKIAFSIVALVVVIPTLLFVIGLRNYAAHISITSFFGIPIIIILMLNQNQFEKYVRTPRTRLIFGRIIFLVSLIAGLTMMLIDRNEFWGPTLYQIMASILVAASSFALIVAGEK